MCDAQLKRFRNFSSWRCFEKFDLQVRAVFNRELDWFFTVFYDPLGALIPTSHSAAQCDAQLKRFRNFSSWKSLEKFDLQIGVVFNRKLN